VARDVMLRHAIVADAVIVRLAGSSRASIV
jgi:hypothetical protein